MTPAERRPHWTENAKRVYSSWLPLMGECDWGDWWVPSWRDASTWSVRVSLWKPWHWPAYLFSRATRTLVWLEPEQ